MRCTLYSNKLFYPLLHTFRILHWQGMCGACFAVRDENIPAHTEKIPILIRGTIGINGRRQSRGNEAAMSHSTTHGLAAAAKKQFQINDKGTIAYQQIWNVIQIIGAKR